MLLLHLLLPVLRVLDSPWRYLGAVAVMLGIGLNLWADRLFKRYGTEVKPFRDSTVLIQEGPFRLTRNPMYLGGMLIFVGLAIMLGTLTPFLVTAAMFWLVTVQFIEREERDLERQFGDRYLEYRRRVRRWL